MVNIKVVGSGCPNCQKLEQLCREVINAGEAFAAVIGPLVEVPVLI